jgi:signal peptidase I
MSEGSDKKTPKSFWKALNREVTVPLIMALLVIQFLVQSFKIPSGSMENSLLVGDFLLGLKFVYGAPIPFTEKRLPAVAGPKPGDVIIFHYPLDPDVPGRDPERFKLLAKVLLIGNFYWDKDAGRIVRYEPKDFIKRCIAKSGQTVQMLGERLWVDGKLQKLPPNGHYLDRPADAVLEHPRDSLGPMRLPRPGELLDVDAMPLEDFIRIYGVAIQERPEQTPRCSVWVELDGKPLADDTLRGVSLPALEDRFFLRQTAISSVPFPDGREIATISIGQFSQALSQFHLAFEIPGGLFTQIEHLAPMPWGSAVVERALLEKYAGTGHQVRLRKRIFWDGKWQSRYVLRDQVFLMMGDNRDNSSDGRFWGLLARRNIKARAFVLYYSFDDSDDGFSIRNPITWLSIPLRTRWTRLGRLVDDP